MTKEEFLHDVEYIYALTKNGDIKFEITCISEKATVVHPYPPCRRWDRSFEISADEAFRIIKKEPFVDICWSARRNERG